MHKKGCADKEAKRDINFINSTEAVSARAMANRFYKHENFLLLL